MDTPDIRSLPLDRLSEEENTRKHFDSARLAELAEDIRAHGVLSPLLVRPLAGDLFGVVCGARRYRASHLVGLSSVPCIVRDLSDREALEAQISENDKRDGVSPVEQADAYLRLHVAHGVEVKEIASRFGVRVAFVNERLAIARACDEVREALDGRRVKIGTAVELARLPSHDYQREAVKLLVAEPSWIPGGHSVAEASQWIHDRYHLRLASAPFDVTDATLTSAGACDTCPKSTEAQRELFGEELSSGAAKCTDPRCYSEKREAEWTRTTATARNDGRRVLSASESAAVVQGLTCAKGYARADVPPVEHGGRKTWKQLLGANYPETVLARAPDGSVVEVLEPEALKAAVKAAGLSKKPAKAKPETAHDDVKRVDEGAARIEAAAIEAVVTEARGAAEDFDHERPGAWDFVARIVCALADDLAVCTTVGELVGHDVHGVNAAKELDQWLLDAAPSEIIGLIATVALRTAPEVDTTEDIYRAVRVALGVDPNKIMEAVREAAKKQSAQKLVKLPKKGSKSKPVEERIEVEPSDDESDDVIPSDPGGVLVAKGGKLKRSMSGAASWVQVATAGNKLVTYDMEGAGPEHLKRAVEIRSADKGAKMVSGFYAANGDELDGEQVAFWDAKAAKKGGAR